MTFLVCNRTLRHFVTVTGTSKGVVRCTQRRIRKITWLQYITLNVSVETLAVSQGAFTKQERQSAILTFISLIFLKKVS